MLMFSFTSLAAVSMALAGSVPGPRLLAALLWVILFFAATVGMDRIFLDEAAAGTLETLRLYAPATAVLLGKLAGAFLTLVVLSALLVPLFLVFIGGSVGAPFRFLSVLLLGVLGIAAAGTLTAALSAWAEVRAGLFAILTFPVILPVFLPAVAVTAELFAGETVNLHYLVAMGLYDLLLGVGASVLFDYVWGG